MQSSRYPERSSLLSSLFTARDRYVPGTPKHQCNATSKYVHALLVKLLDLGDVLTTHSGDFVDNHYMVLGNAKLAPLS